MVIEIGEWSLRLSRYTGHPCSRREHVCSAVPTDGWASRLSLGLTRYLTGLLAVRRPDALVTDQPQPEAPNDRIFLAISTFDVTSAGVATLEADWTIVPRNPTKPTRRQRVRFTATGPVATDQDVVALMQVVLTQLADAIDIASLR